MSEVYEDKLTPVSQEALLMSQILPWRRSLSTVFPYGKLPSQDIKVFLCCCLLSDGHW